MGGGGGGVKGQEVCSRHEADTSQVCEDSSRSVARRVQHCFANAWAQMFCLTRNPDPAHVA